MNERMTQVPDDLKSAVLSGQVPEAAAPSPPWDFLEVDPGHRAVAIKCQCHRHYHDMGPQSHSPQKRLAPAHAH